MIQFPGGFGVNIIYKITTLENFLTIKKKLIKKLVSVTATLLFYRVNPVTKKKCPPGRLRYLLHKGQYEVFISAWVHDAVGGTGISGFSGFQVTGMIKGFFGV